jgi:hypothetical protein
MTGVTMRILVVILIVLVVTNVTVYAERLSYGYVKVKAEQITGSGKTEVAMLISDVMSFCASEVEPQDILYDAKYNISVMLTNHFKGNNYKISSADFFTLPYSTETQMNDERSAFITYYSKTLKYSIVSYPYHFTAYTAKCDSTDAYYKASPDHSILKFTVTDNCNNGSIMTLNFSNESRSNAFWGPYELKYGETSTVNMSCHTKDTICYDARSGNNIFGLNSNSAANCTDCCWKCDNRKHYIDLGPCNDNAGGMMK